MVDFGGGRAREKGVDVEAFAKETHLQIWKGERNAGRKERAQPSPGLPLKSSKRERMLGKVSHQIPCIIRDRKGTGMD